jgi:hypothetical protein
MLEKRAAKNTIQLGAAVDLSPGCAFVDGAKDTRFPTRSGSRSRPEQSVRGQIVTVGKNKDTRVGNVDWIDSAPEGNTRRRDVAEDNAWTVCQRLRLRMTPQAKRHRE